MCAHVYISYNKPLGKESTKVEIRQNKGKERENSYQKLKRSPEERHIQAHGNLFEIFQRSQTSLDNFWKVPPGCCKRGRDGGKFKSKSKKLAAYHQSVAREEGMEGNLKASVL